MRDLLSLNVTLAALAVCGAAALLLALVTAWKKMARLKRMNAALLTQLELLERRQGTSGENSCLI